MDRFIFYQLPTNLSIYMGWVKYSLKNPIIPSIMPVYHKNTNNNPITSIKIQIIMVTLIIFGNTSHTMIKPPTFLCYYNIC